MPGDETEGEIVKPRARGYVIAVEVTQSYIGCRGEGGGEEGGDRGDGGGQASVGAGHTSV